ncbi:MAG: FISUMP domain-containing protein [Saprospiraceae bacterium]|nr:FISUMP domain-containing protein [Saprospiraceae bacterium]
MKYIRLALGILPVLLLSFGSAKKADNSVKPRPGKDYALFFAVKEYDYDSWLDLQNPIRDAEAIAQELQDRYDFATEVVPNPTQAIILNKLREYSLKQYDEDAQLFIFFSGHGNYDVLTTEGFLIPRDGKPSAQDVDGTTWISHDRLETRITSIPCKHILLAIDACFSGTFDRRIALGKNEEQVLAFVEQGLKYKSRLYLTSGGKEYTSDGTEHSPFTREILSALRLDENDLITFPELVSKMQFVKPEPRSGEFAGNEAGGNFYFIGKNANIPRTDNRFHRPAPPNKNENSSLIFSYSFDPNYKFKTLELNGKTWMAENLNIQVPNSWCVDNYSANCLKYKRLYTWEAASNACKSIGWRLPTGEEWSDLINHFSDKREVAFKSMKQGGNSGFDLPLGGWRDEAGKFERMGSNGFYWTSEEFNSITAWIYDFNTYNGGNIGNYQMDKQTAISCRCIKD